MADLNPGEFDFGSDDESDTPPASSAAAPIGVFLYDPSAEPAAEGELDSAFTPLPNVVCEQVDRREGAEPSTARFRYLLDRVKAATDGWPADFAALWPVDADGDYTVLPDARILVVKWTPDGDPEFLFDGYASIPKVRLADRTESVTFAAAGVETRCYDTPIGGRWERSASDPKHAKHHPTDLPTRFNPTDSKGKSKPNATPQGYDLDGDEDKSIACPLFLEANLVRDPDPRDYWTLSGAVRYLLRFWNPQTEDDGLPAGEDPFVVNPDFDDLDALLRTRKPKEGADAYDPADESTYDADDIILRDYDATNKPVLAAVAELVGFHGFGMELRLAAGEDGRPETRLELYRKDADPRESPRGIHLDEPGTTLDAGLPNILAADLARDINGIVNEFRVEAAQRRVEVSVILVPGFTPANGDEKSENRKKYKKARLADATAEVRNKYRLYVADEASDGHFDFATNSYLEGADPDCLPLDLSPVFPDDDEGTQTYANRLRPGSNRLISKDSKGKPLRRRLDFSRDYTGPAQALWDGTGTWQEIAGGFELLEDRLGIYVTAEDPEAWPIGDPDGVPDSQEKSKVLRGISSLSASSETEQSRKRFYLRLTTVIEDDFALTAVAAKRVASPTKFHRRKRIDCRDHFAHERVAAHSAYNESGDEVVARDDTEKAEDHAKAHRAAHEFPALAGTVSLIGIDTSIRIGDRIERIAGRDVTLRRNIAADHDEAPSYPVVVALGWRMNPPTTTIQLSDRRAEPQKA